MDICKTGDAAPEHIWGAVGKVLSQWEDLQTAVTMMFALLFPTSLIAAQRAFGAVSNRQSQRQMFIGAAEVVLRKAPDTVQEIDDLLKAIDRQGSQRDKIAHGVIYAEATYEGATLASYGNVPDRSRFTFGHTGAQKELPAQFFLVPPALNSRHSVFTPDEMFNSLRTYKYNSKRIKELASKWHPLKERALALTMTVAQHVIK